MKLKRSFILKYTQVFLGIALGLECLGSTISRTRSQMNDIDKAICIFAMDHNGKLPASLDELVQFASNNNEYSKKPLLTKDDLTDAWGTPIEYERSAGRHYILRSAGPDRKMGTADDALYGDTESYKRGWQPKPAPPVAEQEPNTVQDVTTETTQPPAGTEKVGANRVPATVTPPPAETDEPTKTKTAPWEIPLFIAVLAVIGAMAAWRCFRKK